MVWTLKGFSGTTTAFGLSKKSGITGKKAASAERGRAESKKGAAKRALVIFLYIVP